MANNNVFLNLVKESNIWDKTSKAGRKFNTVSVKVPTDVSVSGFASFSVNPQQLYDNKVSGYKNVLLGAADKEITLSVFDGDVYTSKKVSAVQLVDIVKTARAAK